MIQLPKQLILSVAALTLLLASPSARAEQCANKSCPAGFVCEEHEMPCDAAPPCPAGETCPEPPTCEPEMVAICVPSPCTSDADCGGELSCVSFSTTICEEVDQTCAVGEECPEPLPAADCQEVSESFCAPAYIGPCAQDSDCGEGFLCQPGESCSCSGSGGSAEPGNSADPADSASPADEGQAEPYDESCECHFTGDNYCVPQEISCSADADCPDGWSCEDAGKTAVTCSVDAQTGETQCLSAEDPGQLCLPLLWESWGAANGSYEAALDRASSGELGAQLPDDQNKSEADSGGCAVAAAPRDAAAILPLLLLGLALLVRRRAQLS